MKRHREEEMKRQALNLIYLLVFFASVNLEGRECSQALPVRLSSDARRKL